MQQTINIEEVVLSEQLLFYSPVSVFSGVACLGIFAGVSCRGGLAGISCLGVVGGVACVGILSGGACFGIFGGATCRTFVGGVLCISKKVVGMFCWRNSKEMSLYFRNYYNTNK